MYDDLNENKSKKLALPIGIVKIPKFLYIIVIILSALILVVGGLNIYLQKQKVTKSSKSSSLVQLSNLQIAEKTLAWINSFKNKDGVYSVGCECSDQLCQQCKEPIYIERIIPFVLWSKFKYAERKNNYDDFIKEVNLSQNSIKEHALQYSGWDCKLLYEAWKSDKLPQTTKDQIKNFCVKSEYEFEDGLKLPSGLDEILLTNVEKLKNNQLLSDVDNKNDLKEFFYNNAFLVSEMVTRKLWEGLPDFVYMESNLSETDLAKIYFNKALIGYSMKNETEIKDNTILGIASVDMYKLTKNEKYLDFAKYLLSLKSKFGNTNPYSLIYQSLLAKEILAINQDQSYQSILEISASNIIKNNKENTYQKGAFKAQSDAYYLRENCLIAGLLSTL